SKGYKETWIGYKLHIDVACGQIPVACVSRRFARTPRGEVRTFCSSAFSTMVFDVPAKAATSFGVSSAPSLIIRSSPGIDLWRSQGRSSRPGPPACVGWHLIGLCFTLCGTPVMLHVRLRDGIRKDGKINVVGAEAECLACRARRSRLD